MYAETLQAPWTTDVVEYYRSASLCRLAIDVSGSPPKVRPCFRPNRISDYLSDGSELDLRWNDYPIHSVGKYT